MDAGRDRLERRRGDGLGILSLSRGARPAGRNQLLVAAVRDRQSVVGDDRAVRGDDDPGENASRPLYVGDLCPSCMAGDRDVHSLLRKDLLSASPYRISGAGESA